MRTTKQWASWQNAHWGNPNILGRGRFDFIGHKMSNELLTLGRTRENNERRHKEE